MPLAIASVNFHLAFGQRTKPAFVREFNWPTPPGSTFPDRDWEKIKSSETGNDSSAKLDALRVWLKTQHTTGMLVVAGLDKLRNLIMSRSGIYLETDLARPNRPAGLRSQEAEENSNRAGDSGCK